MILAQKWLQVAWFAIGLAMLVYVLTGYWFGVWSTREPTIVLLAVLVVLSFPLGLVGFLLIGALSDGVSNTPLHELFANQYLEAFVVWIGLTVVGWLQWFVLIPWVFRAMRKRSAIEANRLA